MVCLIISAKQLIDFWASWCKPCHAQDPTLIRLYKKYKDKGFTILGVSLDSKKEAWLKAIYDDKLVWQHVSDLKHWSNAVAKQYKIVSFLKTIFWIPMV